MSNARSMAEVQLNMRNMLEEFPEAQLQIKDRLPYNFLLAQAVLTWLKAILNIQYSAEELREFVQGLIGMLPTTWKDDEFYADLEAAQIQIPVDSRPVFCEQPATDTYCRKHGIQTLAYVKSFDYFKVYNAVTDLLSRRNMLLKPVYKEIFTGDKAGETDQSYDTEKVGEELSVVEAGE
jgi:hypothetical protein